MPAGKKLHEAGKIKRNLFALCCRTVEKEDVSAGFMTIDGVDGRLCSTPMVYSPADCRLGLVCIVPTCICGPIDLLIIVCSFT